MNTNLQETKTQRANNCVLLLNNSMRYYLGQCEYKWTHVNTNMEHIWVRKELGEELTKQCNQEGFTLVYKHSNSQTLPGSIYCRCDIYVDVDPGKDHTIFALKYSDKIPLGEI